MRSPILLAFLFVFVARSASASWQNFGSFAACDFYNAHLGLVCIDSPKSALEIYRDGKLTSVFTAPITYVAIQDSLHAWATDGDSLYLGTKGWTQWHTTFVDSVLTGAPIHLIRATRTKLFVYSLYTLYWTSTGDTLIPTNGIPLGDTILAIDYFSDSNLVAVSARRIYASSDGGMNWTMEFSRMKGCSNVFVDTANRLVFTGGDNLRESSDSGKTWSVVIPPPEFGFGNFGGQVFGAHDCQGTFYVTSSTVAGANSTIMRSQDGGVTFESIGNSPGPSNPFETPQVRGWTFDRGSTIFWNWKENPLASPELYVSHDGGDGVITDSIANDIFMSVDTVFDTLCSPRLVPFSISIQSSVCIPVVIDGITTVHASGKIVGQIVPRTLAGNSGTFQLSYSGTIAGIDTCVLRVTFHSVEWGFPEHRDFTVIANSFSSPPLFIMADSIAAGNVLVTNIQTVPFQISNSGCAQLRIDSMVSSSPSIFRVPGYRFPFFIPRDSTQNFYLIFIPPVKGPYLESLEIGTNAGHRFIELLGEGVPFGSGVNEAPVSISEALVPDLGLRAIRVLGIKDGSEYEFFDVLGRNVGRGILHGEFIPFPSVPNGLYFIACDGHVAPFAIRGE